MQRTVIFGMYWILGWSCLFAQSPAPNVIAFFEDMKGRPNDYVVEQSRQFFSGLSTQTELDVALQMMVTGICQGTFREKAAVHVGILTQKGAQLKHLNPSITCVLKRHLPFWMDQRFTQQVFALGLSPDIEFGGWLHARYPDMLIAAGAPYTALKTAIEAGASFDNAFQDAAQMFAYRYYSIFHHAVARHEHELIRWLLARDPEAHRYPAFSPHGLMEKFYYFESPVSLALRTASKENLSQVQQTLALLQAAEVPILLTDFQGLSPLDVAREGGHPQLIDFVERWTQSALQSRPKASRKLLKQLKLLSGWELDTTHISTPLGPMPALTYAAYTQNLPLARALMQQGANPLGVGQEPEISLLRSPYRIAFMNRDENLLLAMVPHIPEGNYPGLSHSNLDMAMRLGMRHSRSNLLDDRPAPFFAELFDALQERGAQITESPYFLIHRSTLRNPDALSYWVKRVPFDGADRDVISAFSSLIESPDTNRQRSIGILYDHGLSPRAYTEWKQQSLFDLSVRRWALPAVEEALRADPRIVVEASWVGRKDSLAYRNPLSETLTKWRAFPREGSYAYRPERAQEFLDTHLDAWQQLVKALKAAGADPNRADYTSYSPLETLRQQYPFLPPQVEEILLE